MHSSTYSFAHHVDSTTLADSDYQVVLEQGIEPAEDLGNTVEGLTEVPNQISENFDPTVYLHYFIYTAMYLFIYFYALSS
jgi:hypothetical protein